MNKFSQLYLRQNKLEGDSKRARIRIFAHLENKLKINSDNIFGEIYHRIEIETGAPISFSYTYQNTIKDFLISCETRDFLDSISIVYFILKNHKGFYIPYTHDEWATFVTLVFKEEELRYYIDHADGSIKRFIDDEFEHDCQTAIASLNSSKYELAAIAFNKAIKYLVNIDPDYRSAVKYVFECAEVLFKKITSANRLSRKFVNDNLHKLTGIPKEDCEKDPVLKGRIGQFNEWIDALHDYRHGQTDVSLAHVSEGIAVFYLTTGTAYIRWLVEIDAVTD